MFGPIGTEFTATMGDKDLSAGAVVPLEREPSKALYVIALDGLTAMGSQWYKFRIIASDRKDGGE